MEKLSEPLISQAAPSQKSKKKYIFIVLILAVIITAGFFYMKTTGNTISTDTKILLKTNMGEVTILLYSDMPITAGNFQTLVEKKFYDGLIFHRVINGFMIQGGDPKGTGTGGPGYSIKDEFKGHSNLRGTLSMANSGPNSGGSQFFINLVDNAYLDAKHPVFGEVISGIEVIDKIAKVQTDDDDRPLNQVRILEARVL